MLEDSSRVNEMNQNMCVLDKRLASTVNTIVLAYVLWLCVDELLY